MGWRGTLYPLPGIDVILSVRPGGTVKSVANPDVSACWTCRHPAISFAFLCICPLCCPAPTSPSTLPPAYLPTRPAMPPATPPPLSYYLPIPMGCPWRSCAFMALVRARVCRLPRGGSSPYVVVFFSRLVHSSLTCVSFRPGAFALFYVRAMFVINSAA